MKACSQKEYVIAIAMGEILTADHIAAALGAGRECELECSQLALRLFYQLDFIQLLFSAFGLRTARGACPESLDESLLSFKLFLLALVSRLLSLTCQRSGFHISRIIAEID